MRPNKPAPTLFIGLGNPGREYAETRHNAGFLVMERVAELLEMRFRKPFLAPWLEARGRIETRETDQSEIILIKPLTYMNSSGEIIERLFRRHHTGPEQMTVVYDTLDLPNGRLRIRKKGSAGGQKGMASIINLLGHGDFNRIAVGIGHPGSREEVVSHVLAVPEGEELHQFRQGIEQAAEALVELIHTPIDRVMNQYNVTRS